MKDFLDAVSRLWASLPKPLAAAIILAVGWSLALGARLLVAKVFALARFDKVSQRTGFSDFLRKGGVRYSPSKLLGAMAYWVALIVTFLAASRALDIAVVNAFSEKVFTTLSGGLSALFIAVVGAILVSFLSNFVLTIARNAGMVNARLLARAIKYAGNVLIAAIALNQILASTQIISGILLILVAASALGIALAFGLGCKDLAREAMERFIRNLRERERGGQGGDLEG